MALLTRLLAPRAGTPGPLDDYWYKPVSGRPALSGVRVNQDSALTSSALFACVRVIAETMATPPLITYQQQDDGGKKRVSWHPLYSLLHDSPNPDQTAFEFWSRLAGHACLWAMGYAEILPGPRGPVDQLVILHPDTVTPESLPSGVQRYRVRRQSGQEDRLTSDKVFRLPGIEVDGRGIIELARESIGLALVAQEYAARFFSQNGSPPGVLEHPGNLSAEAQKNLLNSWQGGTAGAANFHKPQILEEGMKWHQMGLSAEDAQLLATREFQTEDLARWFRIQPHLIQDLRRSTYSNIEQQSLEFVLYTMMPWFRRAEQRIKLQLIIGPRYFAEFLIEGILRGDLKSRYDAYAVGRQWGWLSVNDILRLENRNPIGPDGDEYLRPLNMVPAGTDTTPVAPPTPPRAPAPPPGNGRARLLAEGVAARLVRRECVALSKLAVHYADDGGAWEAAVVRFYEEHAGEVQRALQLEPAQADAYVLRQRQALLARGVRVLDDWERERPAELAALALGDVA